MKRLLLAASMVVCINGLAACGGGSGTTASALPSPPQATTRLDQIALCGTTVDNSVTDCSSWIPANDSDTVGGGFDNPVDIYYTSAATRAVIFLHGGGGTNYGMAYDLGLNANPDPSTAVDTNFSWLSANKVIAVFPQGQAASGGTTTWSNHVMTSGQDDLTFLQALATYVRNTYAVSSVYLVGHSNGGMMVNRLWCESPKTFDAYVSLAGPASNFYNSSPGNSATNICAPAASDIRPFYSIIGANDTVLCDNGNAAETDGGLDDPVASCDPAATWDSATWVINSSYVNGLSSSAFISNNNLIGALLNEPQQQIIRAGVVCGDKALDRNGSLSNNLNTVWSNCNGQLQLQEVLNANHPLSYANDLCADGDVCSLEEASGAGLAGSSGLLDTIMQFINRVSGQ